MKLYRWSWKEAKFDHTCSFPITRGERQVCAISQSCQTSVSYPFCISADSDSWLSIRGLRYYNRSVALFGNVAAPSSLELLHSSQYSPLHGQRPINMPRQRRSSAAPARSTSSRPTVAPKRPNVTPPQQTTRPTSTAAHQNPTAVAAQKPGAQSSGLFGQMASTAA